MRRWFLSYHSPDQALAERLKVALERKNADARVFFAPSSLRAGGFWSRTLAEEIAQADVFILLVGERGVGVWQVLEYDEALDKRLKSPDFPVILVLLEGQTAPGLPFLRRLHWIVTPDPSSEKDVARLFDAAAGSGARLGELWRYTSPYRGLAAMEEDARQVFPPKPPEASDSRWGLAGLCLREMLDLAIWKVIRSEGVSMTFEGCKGAPCKCAAVGVICLCAVAVAPHDQFCEQQHRPTYCNLAWDIPHGPESETVQGHITFVSTGSTTISTSSSTSSAMLNPDA